MEIEEDLSLTVTLRKKNGLREEGRKYDGLISWCLGPELNRHGGGPPRDFKSLASTNSATQALFSYSVHWVIGLSGYRNSPVTKL